MANNPEAEFKKADEKGQSEVDSLSLEDLTTKDKIEKLIDNNLDAVNLADLRSVWGRRELFSILEKAEELGRRRGFSEGVMEEEVQDTCNDIIGYMLAEVDDGRKCGSSLVSLEEAVEEQDVTVTHQAMMRARRIFNEAELPAQVGFRTSQNDEGKTLFNFYLNIDLQPDKQESTDS